MNFEIIFCFNINLFVTPLPRNDKLHYQSILEIGTPKNYVVVLKLNSVVFPCNNASK